MAVDRIDELYPQHVRSMMQRTDRSLAATGFDALVIHSGIPPNQFLDDQTYPYKVNPHFKAWVPVMDNPQSLLVYRPGQVPQVLFHQPDDFWHMPAALPNDVWTHSVELRPMPDPAKASAAWAKLGRVAFIGNADCFDGENSESVNDSALLSQLHFDRAVKTPYELECMRRANSLGARGHRAALAAFRSGASEYQTQMRFLEACALREEELPYNSIIAYNEHGAVLHYQHLARQAPPVLRSFLIDAGAQYRGYASDITRTYASMSGRFAELTSSVNEVQLRLCDEIRPGTDYRDVHLLAHRLLGDVMQRCGLTTLSAADAVDRGVTSVFFPHGIGHLLGLQVHDVGGVMGSLDGSERQRPEGHPYLRLTRMLEPGVVVTVEPGVYFIDTLLAAAHASHKRDAIDWSVVEELRPFGGIRIEDNVATTATAPENLTRQAFATQTA